MSSSRVIAKFPKNTGFGILPFSLKNTENSECISEKSEEKYEEKNEENSFENTGLSVFLPVKKIRNSDLILEFYDQNTLSLKVSKKLAIFQFSP